MTRRWPNSLRGRLTGWYMLLLCSCLLLFSWYLYEQQERSLLAQVDAALELAAHHAVSPVRRNPEDAVFHAHEQVRHNAAHLVESGFSALFLDVAGNRMGAFGHEMAPPPDFREGFVTIADHDQGGPHYWRLHAEPVAGPDGALAGWVLVARPLDLMEQALASLYQQILIGLPLVLLVSGLGGAFLAGRALRPLRLMSATAQRIEASDLSRRIPLAGAPDEIAHLAVTFNGMLERLQAAFEREARFTSDAAHELRTPLTALRGRIEVALSRERGPEEYRTAMLALQREVERLIRLSCDLLYLAHLCGGAQMERETLSLRDLLHSIVDQMEPLAAAKSITVTVNCDRDLAIVGDPDRLIRAFLNLVDNAIKFTPDGGAVTISAEPEADDIRVAFADTGPGLPAHLVPRVFERFFRAAPDRSRETGGAGLGLSIVREIAEAHGGGIDVATSPEGTTFALHLPASPPAG